jgi:hypothetical protein
MSQRTVQLLIGQIVTDEELRRRFIERPGETLIALSEQGFDLTNYEIEALVRTETHVWEVTAGRIDPRLQRCSLRPDSDS